MLNPYFCAVKKKKITLNNIEVTDYAAEGKSLARIDGKVIFIEGAVPGDVVDVFITKNKKDWAEGRAIHFHAYSSERNIPFCSHFGTCGGCKWQMLPYEKQLQYKQQEAIQNLQRIGKVDIGEILPITGADETIHYRNKLEFTFSNKEYRTHAPIAEAAQPEANGPAPAFTRQVGAETGGALGYHAPRIFDKAIDIRECFLMDEINNTIRNSLRTFATENNYSFYAAREHTGWLRNIVIRYTSIGELMVNVILGYEDETETKKLMDFLLQKVPSINTLLYTINTKWNDSIYDLEPIVYQGKGFIHEKLEDYIFKISPKSFFQTNSRQAQKLYSITRDFAQLTGNETVYDLYCGTGSIGIFVSGKAKKIIGVEVIDDAIKDARENAALNNITHAEFFTGDVIKICDDAFFAQHGRPDVVITDPPRAGMHEKLVQKLLQMEAPRIVYVSCNTATQARDLNLLKEKYDVKKIQAVDMFPHTHHIECVALLELK